MIWDEALVLTVNQKWKKLLFQDIIYSHPSGKNCYFRISSTAILQEKIVISGYHLQPSFTYCSWLVPEI